MRPLNPLTRRTAFIVAAAAFMQMLDGAIINTSLPQMAAGLNVHPVQMGLGITVYMLVVAVFMPLSAWLSERFNALKIFLAAILVFTLGSVACGLAHSLDQFIMARALQGIGGAMMVPVGRIIMLRQASKAELLEANTFITWPALVAPVIGPIIGSFVTTYLGWRWNFLLNLPLGLMGCFLVYRYLPETHGGGTQRFDWQGFGLTASALSMLLYGLEVLGRGEIATATPWLLIGAGCLLGTWAIKHLTTTPAPLLDLAPFKLQSFSLATLSAGTWIRISISATPFLIPLLYQLAFGLTAIEASGFLFAYFLGNFGMKAITTLTLRTFGFRRVLFINGLICSALISSCALFSAEWAKWAMMTLLFLAGLSRSMEFTALSSFAFADIDQKSRSSASALTSMLQQLAMLLGVALSSFLLQVTPLVRGHLHPDISDFKVAFLFNGLLAFYAALMFLKLPANAGEEVSGHKVAKALSS